MGVRLQEILCILAVILYDFCGSVTATGALSPNDPSSYSRPELAVVKHVKLKWNVNFDEKIISGTALLLFEALEEVDQVVLDVSSLAIETVELENSTALQHKLDGHIPNFGSRLTIRLPETVTPNDKYVVDKLGVENPLTKLVLNLTGVHPDDSFSTVPYEKGSLFLRYLEDITGAVSFEGFVRSYLNNFQRRSLDTEQFKAYLLGYFTGKPAADKLALVQWGQWLHSPGMPPAVPDYDTSMTKAITNLLERIDADPSFSAEGFTPHQVIHFLQEMVNRRPLAADRLEEMGAAYKVADSHNSEIRYRWLRLCVKSRVLSRVPEVLSFVNDQGRMKFVRPLYRDLYAWEEVRERAVANFLQHEPRMMHVAAYTVRKDLHLTENLLAQQ